MPDTPATTEPPMAGIWILTRPDGKTYTGPSPLKCVSTEQRERVPPKLAVQRIMNAASEHGLFEVSDERIHQIATEAGFNFYGKWLLYQGGWPELSAFARAILAEAAKGKL